MPKKKDSQPEPTEKQEAFPVVGIGASAGGLEAFVDLLKHLPADIGMAYVIVQHLDPKHESMLGELLARATPMRVVEAQDGMHLEADHIYVIPPNTDMSVMHNQLQLVQRKGVKGAHMPVDYFLRSLAEDKGAQAIGIILSGTASDGTEGLRAIKGAGGITFAQEEATARYTGMPHSAIGSGMVDFILSPEGIASELARIGKHPYLKRPEVYAEDTAARRQDAALQQVFILLRNATGVDFSCYKLPMVKRRTLRRMALHQIESLADYVNYLRSSPTEITGLYQDLLIAVTGFFREQEAFDVLKSEVYPALTRDDRGPQIRIWVPGCSTGEEAYALAISLLEFLGDRAPDFDVQIFATDLNEAAIDVARTGAYYDSISADVSPERLKRFFMRTENGYQISKRVREMCIFARHNVIKDPPFSNMDLVSCRNLLIYLDTPCQRRVLAGFHYALKLDGYLLLGKSETVGKSADLFSLTDRKHKLYTKKSMAVLDRELLTTDPLIRYEGTRGAKTKTAIEDIELEREADRLVLSRFAPAGVVINPALQVLQFRGRTGDYLEPPTGTASLDILRMARQGLQMELRKAIFEAGQEQKPVRREGIRLRRNGDYLKIAIEVIPLQANEQGERNFLVLFEGERQAEIAMQVAEEEPVETRSVEEALIKDLENQLAETREYLNSLILDHDVTLEELRSTNEEMLSSNEELQSTNEEMETAKEELQSTNEELITVNEELQTRNLELADVNADLAGLLNNIDIPIVMLGNDMRIRRFTPRAEEVMNLIPGDIGRPLTHINLNLSIDTNELERQVVRVLKSASTEEREVHDSRGRWLLLRVQPYRSREGQLDGAVLTLIDIDVTKRRAETRVFQDFAEDILEAMRMPLLVLDSDLRVVMANRAYYEVFQENEKELVNKRLKEVSGGAWNVPHLLDLLGQVLSKKAEFRDLEMEQNFPGIGRRLLLINANQLFQGGEGRDLICVGIQDVTRYGAPPQGG